MTATEPFKFRTYLYTDGNQVATYCQCYEYYNKAEMLFFVSSKKKEIDVLDVSWFQVKRGERGNKKPKFYVLVYTPRDDKQ